MITLTVKTCLRHQWLSSKKLLHQRVRTVHMFTSGPIVEISLFDLFNSYGKSGFGVLQQVSPIKILNPELLLMLQHMRASDLFRAGKKQLNINLYF